MENMYRDIIKDREQSTVAEAYRAIRGNILAAHGESGVKTILFVSSSPGESSAVIAANTAVSLAFAGKKVILIDGDLRKPVVHEIFNLPRSGLTNLVLDDKPFDDLVRETKVSNLWVMTSGPVTAKPLEVLAHGKLRALIEELKTKFDFVIVNGAPLILTSNAVVTDTCVLAAKVDGVVVVVDSMQVRVKAARKVMQLLRGAKAHIVGIVLNDADADEDFICSC